MPKKKYDHTILVYGVPEPCTKKAFDRCANNDTLTYRWKFLCGDDEIPASFELETDAAVVSFMMDWDDAERRGDRTESDPDRHEPLEGLSDHSSNLQDKTVDVAADGTRSAEIAEMLQEIEKLPDNERELIQTTQLGTNPMKVEDYAWEKDQNPATVRKQIERIKVKLANKLRRNIS